MKYTNKGSFTISLPSAQFDAALLSPVSVEIVQEARHHDAALIRYQSRRVDWRNTMAPGTPIGIRWRSRTSPESRFFGYITNVKPLLKHDNYLRFDVYAVGASRTLRQTGQNVWRNLSAPQIASHIARQFRLKPVVVDHPMRKPQVVQSGRTYWEVLTDLAEQIGYALRVEGTTLYFMPISVMVSQGFIGAPVLTALNAKNKTRSNPEYAVFNFESITGLNNEVSAYTGEENIINAASPDGSVVSSSRKPGSAVKRSKKVSSPFPSYIVNRAVYSKRDADSIAQGQAENGLLAIDANVESEGVANMKPYTPVYLETQRNATSGWWVAKSVRHRFSKDGPYVCESVLSTDSIYPSSGGKPRGLQNLMRRPPTTSLQPPGRTVLRPVKETPVTGRTSDVDRAFEWVAV